MVNISLMSSVIFCCQLANAKSSGAMSLKGWVAAEYPIIQLFG